MNFVSDLDATLLKLSEKDELTMRDAMEGILCTGQIGSGKTSGTGRAIRRAYLRAGMGGLVLVAKPEEIGEWILDAKENGREDSLILFDEKNGYDFISHSLGVHGVEGIGTVAGGLTRVVEAADQATGNTGIAGDPFWPQSRRQNLHYCIPVIYSAYGTVTITNIIDFVVSAGSTAEHYTNPEWVETSYAAKTLLKMHDAPAIPLDTERVDELLQYWFRQWPGIPEKTRGSIVITLSSSLDRFRHGRLKRMFCEKTTIVPEMLFSGAVILMCTPALTWGEDGIVAQQLFMHAAQKAIEMRNSLEEKHRLRPIMLYADEFQYFLRKKTRHS